jgi:hypothetical protein
MISVSTTFCSASTPSLGLAHPLGAFELEGLRDDTHGQHAQLARGLRDDRGRPGAGAAAHPGGDEAHVRTGEVIDDLLDGLLGRAAPTDGLGTRAEPSVTLVHPIWILAAHGFAAAPARRCWRRRTRPLKLFLDHVVDRIAAGAAHAEHGDARLQSSPGQAW